MKNKCTNKIYELNNFVANAKYYQEVSLRKRYFFGNFLQKIVVL